ncbi:ATP synthase F1 subunit gamma [candidate division WWE3 bacterium]|uniref:ATP synthase gamma chain n=1 Tax=candidate division WWE3 bacterium TaxID=2053526 RepID=A0A7X9HGS8_UNCKA|nr:ATP synthase F1 subunit gamma [candidate division WWE3 bacterium]
MSKIKEYRNRIKSVGNIKKITKSMQMIAVSKMRKAEKTAKTGKAYHENIEQMFRIISKDIELMKNPLFFTRSEGKKLIIVFSPSRGFAGNMLMSELNAFYQGIKDFPKEGLDAIIIGKKLKRYVYNRVNKIVADFSDIGEYPTIQEIRGISQVLLDEYRKGSYNEIFVLYTDYINSLKQQTRFVKLLPAILDSTRKFSISEKERDFVFEPERNSIIDSLVSLYIDNSLYQFKAETVASEFAARMTAMKDATDKAESLGNDLKIELNKLRQDIITRELGEISAGTL